VEIERKGLDESTVRDNYFGKGKRWNTEKKRIKKCVEEASGEFICINKEWGIGEGLCGKALKLGKENCLLEGQPMDG
jgi:hypothetical protein